ncbi:Cryptic asc operon repressor [Serratia odorifera]|uniref:Cryptic asc operon repressor n=1 Tax=Serratia odorifera TaxID=618 RepID=A0A3S4EB57_SEROD|nr:Cryptic asc operon repressor [Serratia odorifera]
MITMLDVSIRAGVSKATVSRVLNGTGQVKKSTRDAVFKAMDELGYRPNFLASRWRTKAPIAWPGGVQFRWPLLWPPAAPGRQTD